MCLLHVPEGHFFVSTMATSMAIFVASMMLATTVVGFNMEVSMSSSLSFDAQGQAALGLVP